MGVFQEDIDEILCKILPLSCMQTVQQETHAKQAEINYSIPLFCVRQNGPVSFLSIEGDSAIRNVLLFQAAVTLCQAGANVVYITSKPLEALPPPVHGMPVPAADFMHRVRFVYLTSAEAVVEYLSSLHLAARLPDALLLDAPAAAADRAAPADAAARGESVSLARLRAGLEEAAQTVAASGGRCWALMTCRPAGRRWQPRTARLVHAAGSATAQLAVGRLTCLLDVAGECVRLKQVSVVP